MIHDGGIIWENLSLSQLQSSSSSSSSSLSPVITSLDWCQDREKERDRDKDREGGRGREGGQDKDIFHKHKELLAAGTQTGSIIFFRIKSHLSHEENEKESDKQTGQDKHFHPFRSYGTIVRVINPPQRERVLNVAITILKFSPCCRYLSVGLQNGIVIVFQVNNLDNIHILHQHTEHKGQAITSLCWSIDSCKLFSGSQMGLLVELNLADNPAMDMMSFAASIFGLSNTLLIGDCRSMVSSIDYYFSPSESSLSSPSFDFSNEFFWRQRFIIRR